MKAEEIAAIKERAEKYKMDMDATLSNEYRIIKVDVPELLAEVERLRSVLQKFATSGTRHDTNPTIGGIIKSADDVTGWYRYMESMDNSVRERAREAL